MRIEIRWKKSTDEGHPRRRVVEIKTPVERETTALEDAVLALPGDHLGNVFMRGASGGTACAAPQINAALEELPTDQDCIEAIEVAMAAARAEIAEADRKHVEEEREKNAEAVEKARQYISTGKDGPWRYIMDRLTRIDPTLAGQVRAEQARQEEIEKAARAKRNAEQAARDEARREKEAADKEYRRQERVAWIGGHGSARLRQQIEAGLDGWPLYLHERLERELPGWELDNDGTDGTPVVNPSEDAVSTMLLAAGHLVELGLVFIDSEIPAGEEPAAFRKAALEHLSIRRIEFPDEDGDDYETVGDVGTGGIYLVCDCYQPGRHPSWSTKRVRIAVSE